MALEYVREEDLENEERNNSLSLSNESSLTFLMEENKWRDGYSIFLPKKKI